MTEQISPNLPASAPKPNVSEPKAELMLFGLPLIHWAVYISIFWLAFLFAFVALTIGKLEAKDVLPSVGAGLAALPALWLALSVYIQGGELKAQRDLLNQNISALEKQTGEFAKSVEQIEKQTGQMEQELALRAKQEASVRAERLLDDLGVLLLSVDLRAREVFALSDASLDVAKFQSEMAIRPKSALTLFPLTWPHFRETAGGVAPRESVNGSRMASFSVSLKAASKLAVEIRDEVTATEAARQSVINEIAICVEVISQMERVASGSH